MDDVNKYLKTVKDAVIKPSDSIEEKIIVNLEENYRIPLILRDLQDYSYREIAELTRKPIGTVKTNIHRARKIIKEKLKSYK